MMATKLYGVRGILYIEAVIEKLRIAKWMLINELE